MDIDITCYIDNDEDEANDGPLAGLCHELEKMAGRNVVKAIKLTFWIVGSYDCTRWDELDDVLMGSPEDWPALRRFHFRSSGSCLKGPGVMIWKIT